jgi:hypothetical protein
MSSRQALALLLLPLVITAGVLPSGCAPVRCAEVAAFGNLGPEVNSPYDDYAPALSDTATIVFTSSRVEPGRGGLQEQYRKVRPTHLYFSMRLTSSWDGAQPYALIFSREDLEAATVSFPPANTAFNTIAYIGACTAANTIGGCDIYAITEGATASLVNLGPELNSSNWDGHPAVTPDGSRLYFASDRSAGPDGKESSYGGIDIWIADRLPSGSWGTPRNAGPSVNSAADEYSPFFDAATGDLYFASQNGSSGQDIFVAPAGGGARRPLPSPYNSEADDFTPFILKGTMYLASNRNGGCGGYDLYGFALR